MVQSYEEALFRYGITCAENLVLLGKINRDQYDELVDFANKGEVPSRDVLESYFSVAVERIGSEKTSFAVHNYFRDKHNDLIDLRLGNYSMLPDSLCEACKVNDAVVEKIERKNGALVYLVKYDSGEVGPVFPKYFPETQSAGVGDRLRIHNFAVVSLL